MDKMQAQVKRWLVANVWDGEDRYHAEGDWIRESPQGLQELVEECLADVLQSQQPELSLREIERLLDRYVPDQEGRGKLRSAINTSINVSYRIGQDDLRLQQPDWTPCAERLPTEADGDAEGKVWVVGQLNEDPYLENWRHIKNHHVNAMASWGYTHWMPTGLTRPAPPEVE